MTEREQVGGTLRAIRQSLAGVLVGQAGFVDRLLIGVLTGGHLLIEGVPGIAKTLAARSLAQTLGLSFHRIQFTPDLLPSDLLGGEVFQPRTGEFSLRRGPIFANVLLADEINRAPAKVQSALLEAMQERQATIAGQSLPLPEPFLVLATQNPIEQEGTYRLPLAQMDRFLLKVIVGYPSREEERTIVAGRARTSVADGVAKAATFEDVVRLRSAVDSVHVDEKIVDYALDLVLATRRPKEFGLDLAAYLELGASPRASIGLVLAARAQALLLERDYVLPHDVKAIAKDVLRHRLMLSFEAEASGLTVELLLDRLLSELPVP